MTTTGAEDRFKPFRRVLPRDLFIESQLLKCLGKLVIYCDEKTATVPGLRYYMNDTATQIGFNVLQDAASGMLVSAALFFSVAGRRLTFGVVYASRRSWPLQLMDDDLDYVDVFDEHGNVTYELTERLTHYASI